MKSIFVLAALAASALASSYSFRQPRPFFPVRVEEFFEIEIVEVVWPLVFPRFLRALRSYRVQDIFNFFFEDIEIIIVDEFFVESEVLFNGDFHNNRNHFFPQRKFYSNDYRVSVPSHFPKGSATIYTGPSGFYKVSLLPRSYRADSHTSTILGRQTRELLQQRAGLHLVSVQPDLPHICFPWDDVLDWKRRVCIDCGNGCLKGSYQSLDSADSCMFICSKPLVACNEITSIVPGYLPIWEDTACESR